MPVHPTIDTDWVEAWLQAAAPDEPQKLQRRLDWDGWSAEAFRTWLDSEPAEQAAAAAEWAAALDHARSLIKAAWDAPLLPYGSDPFLPFVDLWWPLRCQLADDLRRQVWFQPTAAAETAAVNGAVANQLANALLERLCALTDQVLWELFSSGRGPGVMLLAHLGAAGDGSGPPLREHYEAFIRQHRRDGLGSLLDTFPVLQRLIGTVLALWTANSTEMLARISAGRSALIRASVFLAAFPWWLCARVSVIPIAVDALLPCWSSRTPPPTSSPCGWCTNPRTWAWMRPIRPCWPI